MHTVTSYIHVRHIKQPQSISLKFFTLFLNSQTDLLKINKRGWVSMGVPKSRETELDRW